MSEKFTTNYTNTCDVIYSLSTKRKQIDEPWWTANATHPNQYYANTSRVITLCDITFLEKTKEIAELHYNLILKYFNTNESVDGIYIARDTHKINKIDVFVLFIFNSNTTYIPKFSDRIYFQEKNNKLICLSHLFKKNDINEILQKIFSVYLTNIHNQHDQRDAGQQNRKRKEFLFLSNCDNTTKKFCSYLNDITLSILSKLKFYNDDVPLYYNKFSANQLQTKFKIPIFLRSYLFVDFCEENDKSDLSYDQSNMILMIKINTFEQLDFEMMKNMIWRAICSKCSVLFVKKYLFPTVQSLFNLIDIVTYGLAIYDARQQTPWFDFLTKGSYDPRLLIYISQFL